MQTEKDIFKTLKSFPGHEPDAEYVKKTRKTLLKKARKMDQINKVKSYSMGTAGLAFALLFLFILSFGNGKEEIIRLSNSFLTKMTIDHSASEKREPTKNVINLQKIVNSSEENVINMLGTPEKIKNDVSSISNKSVPVTLFSYDSNHLEIIFIEGTAKIIEYSPSFHYDFFSETERCLYALGLNVNALNVRLVTIGTDEKQYYGVNEIALIQVKRRQNSPKDRLINTITVITDSQYEMIESNW